MHFVVMGYGRLLKWKLAQIAIINWHEKMKLKYLYKYMKVYDSEIEEKKYSKRLFLNKELKVHSVTAFNDPFECRVEYIAQAKTLDKLEELCKRLVEKDYPGINEIKKRELINACINVLRNYSLDELINKFKIEMIEFHRNKGVICLTSDPKNILMWSHYADNHRGFCLQFNTQGIFGKAKQIKYSELPKKIDIFEATKEEWFDACLLHKYKTWSYEKEYRLVVNHSNCIYTFNESDLSGVIFGYRMDAKHKHKIIKWLETWKENRDVKLYKVVPIQGEYALKIVEVPKDYVVG